MITERMHLYNQRQQAIIRKLSNRIRLNENISLEEAFEKALGLVEVYVDPYEYYITNHCDLENKANT